MRLPPPWRLLADFCRIIFLEKFMRGNCPTMAAAWVSLFLTLGCSQEKLPFTAKYTSPNQVVVTFQGRQHTLNRHGPAAQAPFRYHFEPDGDLNLFIDGREYDVDSPYDVERKKRSRSKTASARKKKRRR